MIKMNFPQLKLDSECVYHYTSAKVVPNILRKDKIVLRFTHVDYLNDITEGKSIYNCLRSVSKKLFDAKIIDCNIHQRISDLQSTDVPQFSTFYFDKANNKYVIDWKECDVYTMSFSEDSDSLPMWNYYSNNGYCLHFNKQLLNNNLVNQYECLWGLEQVGYDENIEQEIETTILNCLHCKEDEFINTIFDLISSKRFFYKQKVFSYENEIRAFLAVPKNSSHQFDVKFEEKNGFMRPYIEIEIAGIEQLGLIKGITIGPLTATDKKLAIQGIKKLLTMNGYPVAANNVHISHIPVRF